MILLLFVFFNFKFVFGIYGVVIVVDSIFHFLLFVHVVCIFLER